MAKLPSAKEYQRRIASRERWHHTSFLGHCAMGRMQMRAIQRSRTATDTAKDLAAQIETMLVTLSELLKDRKDG